VTHLLCSEWESPACTRHAPWYNKLRTRVWRAGHRIPTERALSEEFGLSRSTVRRVLAELKRKRLITQTVGSGTYVTNNSGNNFLDPYREDYSTLPGIRCNTAGFQAGLVQSFTQKARLRRHSITMQPVVTTTTGALNIYSVKSIAIPFRLYGKTDV
jgi:DNA-binding transcriptional MocR family regulator